MIEEMKDQLFFPYILNESCGDLCAVQVGIRQVKVAQSAPACRSGGICAVESHAISSSVPFGWNSCFRKSRNRLWRAVQMGIVLSKVTQSTLVCRSDGIRAVESHAISSSVPFGWESGW